MDKMRRLLVIGGTGFLGYHIIKEAKKRNFNITSISLRKPKHMRFHKGINYIRADISDFSLLRKKIKNEFEYIINAGGYGSHPDFGKKGNKLIQTHFGGLKNLLKIIKIDNVNKFIQIGSSAEYGKARSPLKEDIKCFPKTPYSIAKLSCTKLLLNLHLKKNFSVTVCRLFQVYGPKQDNNRILPYLINNCKKNKVFLTTPGKQFCDFCYIDDVVKAIFKILVSKKLNGEVINIGSGKSMQIRKLINSVKTLIGKGQPIFGGLKYKKNTNMRNIANIRKAKNKLKWYPKVNLIDGLKKTIKSY
jgi:nucleoside-diphosphate-sugar epimerase